MAVLKHVVAPEGMAAGRGYSHVVTGLIAPGYLLEVEAWALVDD
jgi:hypothetical protein